MLYVIFLKFYRKVLVMYTGVLNKYKLNNIPFELNVSMSEHTTFRVGGPADVYARPNNTENLVLALKIAKEENVRFFVLGRGSNLLFSDEGFRGVIISTENLKSINVEGSKIFCECGVSLTSLSQKARDAGLSGLSFAYGIPGFVGGAVYMNAGAYGGQISDVLAKSTYYDVDNDEIGCVEGSAHNFGYRDSIYKKNNNLVILSAEFELKQGDSSAIRAEMDDYMERRRSKQPLEFPSAGSVFKRPEGYFVGQIVEESGLKGKMIGGAKVSEKHAGFIVNAGGATAKDVIELVNFIKAEIRSRYSVELVCEIIYVE